MAVLLGVELIRRKKTVSFVFWENDKYFSRVFILFEDVLSRVELLFLIELHETTLSNNVG